MDAWNLIKQMNLLQKWKKEKEKIKEYNIYKFIYIRRNIKSNRPNNT